jgi:hypothetical protein
MDQKATNGTGKTNGTSNGKLRVPAEGTGETVVVGCDGYRLHELHRSNPEEAQVLAPLAPEERVAVVHRWLGFGFAVERRASALADARYLELEADRVLTRVQKVLEEEIRRRLDPSIENSFTRPLVDHAVESRRIVADAQAQLGELMKTNFDPNDARSVVSRIGALLAGLNTQLEQRFDPARRDSVIGKFDERFESLVKKLSAPDGPFQIVANELQALRLEVVRQAADRNGKESVIIKSAAKGGIFEDELEARLTALTRVYGDVLERTSSTRGPGGSKKGDFVIELAGHAGRIVIEAKAGAITSMPKLVSALDEARTARGADLAIAVVRDGDDLPAQARPFQFYEEGVVVSFEGFEFAYRVARWVVVVQNRSVPEKIDGAAAKAAIADILAALKHLRPTRAQLAVIEKGAEKMREHLGDVENEIVEAVGALEQSLIERAPVAG